MSYVIMLILGKIIFNPLTSLLTKPLLSCWLTYIVFSRVRLLCRTQPELSEVSDYCLNMRMNKTKEI